MAVDRVDGVNSMDVEDDHFVGRTVRTGTHSCVLAPHLKDSLGQNLDGKYGRMFPHLPSNKTDDAALTALGRAGSVMDEVGHTGDPHSHAHAHDDNPHIPAGFTFLGQLIAHDITADRSLLTHHANFDEVRNFRTPRLDLESHYGAGPSGEPFLYDMDDSDKFLIGINDVGEPNDLPRNRQGRALIGDPRDDVHLMISQLHLAFLKFHNRVVDHVRAQGNGTPPDAVFNAARQLVTWHYQWIVVHEFLPLTVGQELVQDILTHGERFYTHSDHPFLPVEFADAAYRFGHSQIRSLYHLNDHAQGRIFPECGGTCPVPQERVIDWSYFFDMGGDIDASHPHRPQPTKLLDVRFVHPLINLPGSVVGDTAMPEEHSLAYRDLIRARSLDLPSGEAIAGAMGVEPLTYEEIGLPRLGRAGEGVDEGDGWTETPLLLYILKEAEVREGGTRLGPVGGRIVAEVLLGLIGADAQSYLRADREWTPTLPGAQPGNFTMADLLRFAGVAPT
jgi:hypothetical protein